MKKSIFDFLERNNVHIDEDIDSYGYDITKKYLFFLILVIPVSFLMKTILEFIIFLFTFILLRQYLGGLHFKNDNLCFLFSVMIAIFIPFIAKYIPKISVVIRVLIIVITFLIIYYIGVIDNENKELNIIEKKHL